MGAIPSLPQPAPVMRHFLAIVAIVSLAAMPARGEAQRGAAPRFDGPRGYLTLDLSDGEPISSFIEASRLLALSELQKKRLMDIRRALRVQNHPFMARLDSLRQLAGVNLGDRERIRRRDEEALERFNQWARPTIDSIRLNNDLARVEATNVLSVDQRRRIDSILSASRDTRDRNPQRRRPG